MKSPELQVLTASEPITLDQEFEMQHEWCRDPLKCTFIIQSPLVSEHNLDGYGGMVGDVNLFLSPDDPGGPSHTIVAMILTF